ncbi:MAG: hypothetical protein ACPG5B_09965 [Chitinophagales bacterium]
MNKKILIITYYWPPSAGSGVQRWLKFAKYLPQFDWKPIVYTPENPDFNVQDMSLLKDIPPQCEVLKQPIWEPYRLYRKLSFFQKNKNSVNFGVVKTDKKSLLNRLVLWVRGNFFVPDPRMFWVRPSTKFLSNYIETHNIDVIVTTGPPHSMHLIGLALKKRFNKPWIVDIRDPWSSFDILEKFSLTEKTKQKQKRLENEVLENADQIIATSFSMNTFFDVKYANKFITITNGFDEADFSLEGANNQSNKYFNIYHIGLLNDLRNPEHLWLALAELCEENETFAQHLKVVLIGEVDGNVKNEVQNHPILNSKVELLPYMAHDEVLKTYSKADLLLLLLNNTFYAKGNIPGKLFEYLATQKDILCLSDVDSDAAKIVRQCEAGKTLEYNDKAGIKKAVQFYFEKYINKNIDTVNMNSRKQFSRQQLTADLVAVLEKTIK